MKIVSTVRPICDHCVVVRRNGKVLVIHRDGSKHANKEKN